MNLIKENIENLTSMWKLVNEQMKVHHAEAEFEFGVLNFSQWPNRLWFKNEISNNSLKKVKEILLNTDTQLIIPCWDKSDSQTYKLLEQAGFRKMLKQFGMSLELSKNFQISSDLTFEKVNNKDKALEWEKLFSKAFNYKIDQKVISTNQHKLDFLIAVHKDVPIGTVLLYTNKDSVTGIHSMGVIPEKRRKGYALNMMNTLLYQLKEKGVKYAMLQASELGKGLYLKLGFKEEFIIRSYTIK